MSRRSSRIKWAAGAAAFGLGGALLPAQPLQPLRPGTELMADDVNLARSEGVVRRTHAADKPDHPVVEPDLPWEGNRVYIYGTVYRDPASGDFKMWYGSGSGKLLYATSRDGLHWLKPRLGIVRSGGQETNILLEHNAGASILVDLAEPDPQKRYKAILALSRVQRRDGGFQGFYSADGLHWTHYGQYPLVPYGVELGNLIRDPSTKKYFAYIRPYWVKSHPTRMEEKRVGAVTTSDDLLHWSEPKVVLQPDAIDDAWVKGPDQRTEFYAMNGFAYGRSYLGVVPLFRIRRLIAKPGPLQSGEDGPMEGQLIVSRDGLDWHRLADRSPVIPSGPDFDRSIMDLATAPILVGDEVWYYYTGINTTHGGTTPPKRIAVCLAKWRLDGLVSLDAGDAEGTVETTLISDRTGRLEVNVDASGGELKVAVLDAAGHPLPGYGAADCQSIGSGGVHQAVRWADHPRLPATGGFHLLFHLRHADLYSYTITPDSSRSLP